MSERLAARGTSLKASRSSSWLVALRVAAALAVISTIYHVPQAYLPPLLAGLLVFLLLLLLITLGWYFRSVYGGGRAFLLRYQAYNRALDLSDPRLRKQILILDALASLPEGEMSRVDYHRLASGWIGFLFALGLLSPLWLISSRFAGGFPAGVSSGGG